MASDVLQTATLPPVANPDNNTTTPAPDAPQGTVELAQLTARVSKLEDNMKAHNAHVERQHTGGFVLLVAATIIGIIVGSVYHKEFSNVA